MSDPSGIEPTVVPMPRAIVEAVDSINEFFRINGSKQGYVEHNGDWKVIEFCFEVFRVSYPEDLKVFVETQKKIRYNLKHEHGGFEEGEARMQHMMNIPQKMYQLINKFYPQQRWDKKFATELATKLPVFRVPKKLWYKRLNYFY